MNPGLGRYLGVINARELFEALTYEQRLEVVRILGEDDLRRGWIPKEPDTRGAIDSVLVRRGLVRN